MVFNSQSTEMYHTVLAYAFIGHSPYTKQKLISISTLYSKSLKFLQIEYPVEDFSSTTAHASANAVIWLHNGIF